MAAQEYSLRLFKIMLFLSKVFLNLLKNNSVNEQHSRIYACVVACLHQQHKNKHFHQLQQQENCFPQMSHLSTYFSKN